MKIERHVINSINKAAAVVYIDRKPDGTPFYVGKGKARRARSVARGAHHANVLAKYGADNCRREIVVVGSDAYCSEVERKLIFSIGRKDIGTGPLVNLTDGGEGAPGHNPKESTRQLQSRLKKGVPLTESHKANISKALGGRAVPESSLAALRSKDGHRKGSVHTPETKAKIANGIARYWDNNEAARVAAGVRASENNKRFSDAGVRFDTGSGMRGKKHTEETKLKISKSKTGVMTVEERLALREKKLGVPIHGPAFFENRAVLAADRREYAKATGYTGKINSITKSMIADWRGR